MSISTVSLRFLQTSPFKQISISPLLPWWCTGAHPTSEVSGSNPNPCGTVGSHLLMVGSLPYRTLTNCMHWFPQAAISCATGIYNLEYYRAIKTLLRFYFELPLYPYH